MGEKALRVTTGTDEETERFFRAYRVVLGSAAKK
jgi:histidinol-phosphate/aromatic aminotransferase/cobyric acid decarboxylase-like protein